MSDFEVMPIGTKARLEALESYARQSSEIFAVLVGHNPQLMTIVAGERLAHPLLCGARIDGRIQNAGRRYRPGGGKQ